LLELKQWRVLLLQFREKKPKLPQTKPIVSIENVVASADVGQKMDLNEITRTFSGVEYHPDQFPGLVFRIKTPKTATLIFTSGKMVCTGSKSSDLARKAVKTVVQALRKGGIPVKKGCYCDNSKHRSFNQFRWKNTFGTSSKNITKKHV